MRNLKKTLCLVLALVFVLGLCTVGAVNGTDFDDAQKINYKTAVTAMSGLGILKGDDNDGDGNFSFRPSDKVTRAEAAKIIAYVNVGEEVEKWPARQVFDDVPADHWAAKYVTYCQYNNIIAGYGNGKFGPDDPVTQAQLAKMLLSCCGYGSKGEFVGEGWDQNVAKTAFQTKVLKGILSTDWDGPATREETALLAYNTMMSVVQVVLSKDTNDYEPAFINGVAGQTLANSTWDLTTLKGIVVRNKANDSTAKATTLDLYNGTFFVGTQLIYTPDDSNADILGHEVTISYREEGIVPNTRLVAYYVDDQCQEVTGAAANTADLADATYTVVNGNVVNVTPAEPGMAKNNRYRDTVRTYVLNGEGKLVSTKRSTYIVGPLVVNAVTGIATVGGAEVKAPEGAKTGDLMTVYTCGDVSTAKACTKQEKVAINQAQLVDLTAYAMGSWFTYNDGAIQPSDATNLATIDLSTVNALHVDGATGTQDLQVGWSYTLFFDAEGGLIGYADGVETAQAAATNYAVLVDYYGPIADAYGDPKNYAQVVKADGTVQNVIIKAADMNALGAGTVVTIRPEVVGGALTGFNLLTAAGVTISATTGLGSGAVANAAYNPSDPTFDFSNAKFIYYTGVKGNLTAKVASTERPALTSINALSTISYSFKQVKVGTVVVSRVDTVWFSTAAAADPNVANSYIYVVNTDTKEIKLVNNSPINFFNGYKDGVVMDDLRVAANAAPAVGFYKYSLNATTGNYSLTAVAAGTGAATGTREIYLVNNDTNYFILNNTLYVSDGTTKQAIDISNVKFVRVTNTTDYDVAVVGKAVTLDSAAAIQSLLLSVDHAYRVKLNFVEIVTPTAVPGVSVHSIGSGVIYVTSVS